MTKKTMLITSALIIALVGLILLPVSALAIHQPPQPPHLFYGAVIIDGRPARDGLKVTATIAGATLPPSVMTRTSGSRYGDDLRFRVPPDDVHTLLKDGGVNGDTVVFYVDERLAGSSVFAVGGATELNLSVGGRKSLPDPSTLAMVSSGLAPALLYLGLSRLRRRLKRS